MIGSIDRVSVVVGIALVAVALSLFVWKPLWSSSSSSGSSSTSLSRRVPIIDDFASDSFAELAARGEPFVLRRPRALASWRAFEAWRELPFDRREPLQGVMFNERADLGAFFDAKKPAAGVRPSMPELYELRNVTFRQLRRESGGFWIFSQHVNDALAADRPQLVDDIVPLDALLLDADQSINVNLWISSPSVHTHGHYDGYDNLNVQSEAVASFSSDSLTHHTRRAAVVGEKHWLLVRFSTLQS